MVKIIGVEKGSSADRVGIRCGDYLISINGREVRDVLDYRFFLAEKTVVLKIHRNADLFDVTIRKGTYSDIGLEFETPLMDKKHSCENKCIFCFIDQLPKGMRESLYFKDDDSRLSFLHGNYITLTNLKQRDVDRIIEMRISPVNVSVHTTNPELRVKMMKNKRAGEVLDYIRQFAEAGIKLRGQIVLCRGVNDGEELDRTMQELAQYHPSLESVSIVPAGLTAYRENLYPLEPFTRKECIDIIDQVTSFADECLKKLGTRLFFCADELYIKAGRPIPAYPYWEEFTQIENGVGMMASMAHELEMALDYLGTEERTARRSVSIATGDAAYAYICGLVGMISETCPHLECDVYRVKNNFFGGQVTVSGLLTGKDLAEQLKDCILGDELILPRTMLRSEGDLFLCGMTPQELSEKLGVPIRFVSNDGADFLDGILGCGGDVIGR